MKERKHAYDELEATSVNDIWSKDLDQFLEVLEEYERKEEADRLAHGNVSNQGKRKGRAGGAKKTAGEAKKGSAKKVKEVSKPRK